MTSTGPQPAPPTGIRALQQRLAALETRMRRLQINRTPAPRSMGELSNVDAKSDGAGLSGGEVPTYDAASGTYKPQPGGSGSGTFNISQSIMIAGPVTNIVLQPFFIPTFVLPQTMHLYEVRAIAGSFSTTFDVNLGPGTIPGLGGLTAPAGVPASYFPTGGPVNLSPHDQLQVQPAAISSAIGLTVSLFITIVT